MKACCTAAGSRIATDQGSLACVVIICRSSDSANVAPAVQETAGNQPAVLQAPQRSLVSVCIDERHAICGCCTCQRRTGAHAQPDAAVTQLAAVKLRPEQLGVASIHTNSKQPLQLILQEFTMSTSMVGVAAVAQAAYTLQC